MKNSVSVKIRSYGRCIVYNSSGQVDRIIPLSNLVTTNGEDWLTNLLGDNTALFLDDMEFGTSDTVPTKTDTGVTTLIGTKSVTLVPDTVNDRVDVRVALGAGDFVGQTIKEIAILLDDTSCFNHSVFAGVVKGATIMIFEWRIEITTA